MNTTGIAAFALCISLAFASIAQAAAPKGSLALVGGTVYIDPETPPIENGVVLIRDGVIVAADARTKVTIPRGVAVIDCTGMTVTAGFWNSHVHFHERKWFDADKVAASDLNRQLQDMLTKRGFTSVFDTWSNFANTQKLRARVESGEIAGPRIRTTGEALMLKGGVPPQMGESEFAPVDEAEVVDAAEASAAVKKLLDNGVDGVKVYAMTYPQFALTEETMAAAASEAHRRGKLVFAHPTMVVGLTRAVRAGADVIVHTTPLSGPWDDATLALMKEKNVALIPTLKLWRYETRTAPAQAQQRLVGNGVTQLQAWVSAGGIVLFGTDVGYMQDYDTAEEFTYMARAGMDHREILASLTTAPALRFGDAQRLGKLVTGFLGDVTVMSGRIADSIDPFAMVAYAIRDGVVIYDSKRQVESSK